MADFVATCARVIGWGGRGVRHLSQNTGPVQLARASWIVVVVVCAIAVILLGVGGYTGYAITVAAVGMAAAVNLLPSA
jgi:hypothetical protein